MSDAQFIDDRALSESGEEYSIEDCDEALEGTAGDRCDNESDASAEERNKEEYDLEDGFVAADDAPIERIARRSLAGENAEAGLVRSTRLRRPPSKRRCTQRRLTRLRRGVPDSESDSLTIDLDDDEAQGCPMVRRHAIRTRRRVASSSEVDF